MALPFVTGQVLTAIDLNSLAVASQLAASGGAALIGYGGSTVKAALDGFVASSVISVAGRTGAVVLSIADVSGAAALNGNAAQNFNVKNATGSNHAVNLAQADARYAPFGSTGTGTVTSVGLSLPADYNIGGSPVTGAGTIAVTRAAQPAKAFLAAPTGSSGTPVYRGIAVADIPTLNQDTTGLAGGLSAILAVSSGGTGQGTAQAAIDVLTAVSAATNEWVLTKDTATGHAKFKPASAATGYEVFVASFSGADPTGATSSSAAFSAAVTAAGATGQVRVTKGTWNLATNTPSCNWVVDAGVAFSGFGQLVGLVEYTERFDTFPGTPKQGAYFGRPGDPLVGIGNYNTIPAAIRGISAFACTGVLGGSQSQDNPTVGAMGCIGVTAFSNNNNTVSRQYSYGAYVEAHRAAGAGSALGVEIDVANHGSTAQITPNGWSPGVSGVMDVTAMLWLASGGAVSGVNDVSCAVAIIPNGAMSQKGIVILNGAIAGDSAPSGGTEYDAMCLPYQHAINWWDTGNIKRVSIRGDSVGGQGVLVMDGPLSLVSQATATSAGAGPYAVPATCSGFLLIGIGGVPVKIPFYG